MSLFSQKSIAPLIGLALLAFSPAAFAADTTDFKLEGATIADVHAAIKDGKLTARR